MRARLITIEMEIIILLLIPIASSVRWKEYATQIIVVAIEWVKGILVVDREKTTEEIMNLAGQNMTTGGMIIAAGAHHGTITTVGHNSTKRPAVEDTATGHNIITTMKKGTTIHLMLLITVAVLLGNMTARGITTTTGHLKSTPRNLCRRSLMMIMAEFKVPRILK